MTAKLTEMAGERLAAGHSALRRDASPPTQPASHSSSGEQTRPILNASEPCLEVSKC